ncbi:hypothetical protein D7D52_29365 [Nocardia yunnanensis]|uniref:MFS transporter n=1 Tax=Nocardia yunnanensis TaxID=2382165 RepID=A0A386ZH53_9NOCA|nr:hypothetical protein [Nocardia yunnanensis]AYF77252.1 hypothetical protein D7D52_29365 [Nocardia yunnanensis]
MRSYQVAVETFTALVTATVAGLALALPIDFGWTSQTSALQLDLLAYSLPRAIAAGVLVAMIVAVLLTTLGSPRAAWITTAGGLVALLANHSLGHASDPHSSLSTMNFIDSLAGGLVLGALGAAVLHHRLPAFGWTLGILISLLLGSVNPVPRVGGTIDQTVGEHWQATDMPPVWMIVLALILAVLGVLANRKQPVTQRVSIELPLTPILAGVLLVLITLASAEWLSRHGGSLAGVFLAAATAVGTAMIAAMLLPGRDGEIVLLAVGLSAVGSATIAAELPAWSVPLLVAVSALGMWTGSRHPATYACLGAAILAGLLTALDPDTELAVVIVGEAAIVSWLFGFALVSVRPRYVPSRVLGTMVIFVPSAVLGMRDYAARGDYALQSTGHAPLCTVDSGNTALPAWTSMLVAAGCAAGVLALRRSRPQVAEPNGDLADATATD